MKKLRVNLVSESDFTVQGHGVHTAFLEMRQSLEAQPDVVLTINAAPQKSTDITHIHTVGTFALRRLLSQHGGKKVVSAHIVPASLVGSIVGARWWLPLFNGYLRRFYNRADLVVAVSPATRAELLALGVKTPIKVLGNFIDTQKYRTSPEQKVAFRQELKLPADRFMVVGNGQIQPRKKFETFWAMAKSLPELQFVWVGGIPFKVLGDDYLRLSKAMKRPLPNLRVTGVVSLAEAGRYMRAADIMFMPSCQETFGLAILEGAASGLPVLVRDIPDYHATFGELVLRGEDETFAAQILHLAEDPSFYAKWRANSARLAAKYDTAAATERLMKLYRSILK
ncbi:MAG: glycosyltransferase family 4 protein [Candidatus Nomurabacteria bacterium]|jgi:1,2-diacylglycerol-3-alpha-glucose alpha-1,2-galactosyltransferase|nr:glycosyltransferase family 4 protein [Candidatus Nomurabacteria bacterium]